MKTIHFFGCSLTAGHELPDNDLIPWKKDCKTAIEYYTKFKDIKYVLPISMEEYIRQCRSMAYPSIIEGAHLGWKCINHAEFGSSIKQEIFKIITLIENNIEPVDLIVFQIPLPTREFVITDKEKLETVMMTGIVSDAPEFNSYLEKSVLFHSMNHWTFHAQMDLLMFEGYLLSKNIKSIFIEFDYKSFYDKKMLRGIWKLPYAKIFSLARHLYEFPNVDQSKYTLLGSHYNQHAHNIIADVLSNKIKEII